MLNQSNSSQFPQNRISPPAVVSGVEYSRFKFRKCENARLGNDTEKVTASNKHDDQAKNFHYENSLKTSLGGINKDDLERNSINEDSLSRKKAYERASVLKEIIATTSDSKKRSALNSILLCGTGKTREQQSIKVGYDDGKATYHNVKTCKNRNCPVCANRRAKQYRDEIFLALNRAAELGFTIYFLTLTASHSAMEDYGELSKNLKRAEAKFRKRKLFAEFNSLALGRISTWESTYGVENGYHPHFHGFIITKTNMSFEEVTNFEGALFNDWAECLKTVGLTANSVHGLKLRKIGYSKRGKPLKGVKLVKDLGKMAGYTTTSELESNKFDYEGLKSASNELAFEKNKIGRGGNFSFFELLDYYVELKKSEDEKNRSYMYNIENILRDWAIGNKGNRAANFSTGLKKALGIPQGKNARKEVVEQLKEEGLFFELYKKSDDGVQIDKKNKREAGFNLWLKDGDLQTLEYLRVRHEMLQLVENGKISEADLEIILNDVRNMQLQRQKKQPNRQVIKDLREVAQLYIRRCISESRAIDYDEFMSKVLMMYPNLKGYINPKSGRKQDKRSRNGIIGDLFW